MSILLKLAWGSIFLAISASIAWAQNDRPSSSRESPSPVLLKYPGPVVVPKTEVLLRLDSFGPIKFRKTSRMELVTKDGMEIYESVSTSRLTLSSRGVLFAFKFELLETIEQGKKKSQALPMIVIEGSLDALGSMTNVNFDFPNLTPSQRQSIKLTDAQRKSFEDVIKGVFLPYPKDPVKPGDIIYKVSLQSKFPKEVFGWSVTRGDLTARLRGLSEFDGRKAAIADFESPLEMSNGFVGLISGFWIIDLESGRTLRSESKATGQVFGNVKSGKVTFTEIGEIIP